LNNQLGASQEAVEQAKTAGAPQTAAAQFDAARDKLDRAKAAQSQNDEAIAMRLAQEAQADANLAIAMTGSTHASTAAIEMLKSNQALQHEISRAQTTQQR